MMNRRTFVYGMGVVSAVYSAASLSAGRPVISDSDSLPIEKRLKHEQFMKLAIAQAKKNPAYPFGAVIVNETTGEVMAEGVNAGALNPTYHGEMVVIDAYAKKHGNQKWEQMTLYTTGEPCSMCMSAIAWCGIPRVVWASSIAKIRASGIKQISISAEELAAKASELYQADELISGVLAPEMDKLFELRSRS